MPELPAERAGAADLPALPVYLQVLWRGEDGTRPGPKRGVDLRSIGAAGVKVADADGLAAVSMRRVATELGFTTMALYRYVESKEELLLVMLNEAYGPPSYANASDTGWRDRLTRWAEVNRGALLAHPWIVQVPLREPPTTPNPIGWMELGLDAFSETELTEQEKLSSLLLVEVYVRGQTLLASQLAPKSGEIADPGFVYVSRLRQLMDPAVHPRVMAAVMSGALEDDDSDFGADEFRFGLRALLDGIAALIERRAADQGR